jgi:hypothetical protein
MQIYFKLTEADLQKFSSDVSDHVDLDE